MATYTLFIDESGDVGIKSVRTESSSGASPYMTMGGILVPDSLTAKITQELHHFNNRNKLNGKHCKTLDHEQKVCLSRFIAQQRVLCFGVISRKETLEDYKKQIGQKSFLFYNKCAQYLLERVGLFMEEENICADDLRILFEEGNFDYKALKNLLKKCQKTPRQCNTKMLRRINAEKVQAEKKSKEPLFQLADLVAHSLYKCVDGGKYNVLEHRYLREIKSRFYSDKETKRILGSGIYAIHRIEDLRVEGEIEDFLKRLQAG